ncbi:cytochrome b/b6 domain-containing protein [Streptomyces sp. J2-1]|uniref:cytochrome b/b6 domain-containing protein n=1 Tax=Streptomyces corallincola TaxID=2851888 RepID=UPI001C38C691|nr:cytochrome b/b6 domain-containing protein [Streptomyces corallincola]MBV2357308.1 cytochrome b/b6 domain-containing protein [Streptomyces corallincola]
MNPRRNHSSLPRPGRSAYGVASAVVLLLIPVVVLVGGSQFREFLNFGAGVLCLVSLSCSVIWGLFAQDRIFLNTRQRIVGQAVHRTTSVASIAFLLLHITTKIALDHTQVIAALVPFSLGVTGTGGLIGLGSLAGLLMIFVGVTGALRSNFAAPAPVASRWRAMHMLAYPAWCAALVHGLYAGRQAKPVFVILYSVSLLGVMAAVALRAAPRPVKRRVADRLVAVFGSSERTVPTGPEAGRSRAAESALPGYEGRREPGSRRAEAPYRSPARPPYGAPAEPAADGFAAAYRSVTPRMPQPPYPPAEGPAPGTGSWPVPSPPPVGEAPPSLYDPLQDTGHITPIPGGPGMGAQGPRDVYDTGETTGVRATYNSGDTFSGGPGTGPIPGAPFDAPGTGEPWNTPSGGYR